MRITVKENREMVMLDESNSQNENEVEAIQLSVPDKYADFYKKIVFITPEEVVWDLIENDTYTIKRNITKYEKVDFYIWLTKDEQDFRTKERTLSFNINHKVEGEITPEEQSGMERVIAILEEEITEVNDVEEQLIDLITEIQTKLDNGEFNGQDGVDGQPRTGWYRWSITNTN